MSRICCLRINSREEAVVREYSCIGKCKPKQKESTVLDKIKVGTILMSTPIIPENSFQI